MVDGANLAVGLLGAANERRRRLHAARGAQGRGADAVPGHAHLCPQVLQTTLSPPRKLGRQLLASFTFLDVRW